MDKELSTNFEDEEIKNIIHSKCCVVKGLWSGKTLQKDEVISSSNDHEAPYRCSFQDYSKQTLSFESEVYLNDHEDVKIAEVTLRSKRDVYLRIDQDKMIKVQDCTTIELLIDKSAAVNGQNELRYKRNLVIEDLLTEDQLQGGDTDSKEKHPPTTVKWESLSESFRNMVHHNVNKIIMYFTSSAV